MRILLSILGTLYLLGALSALRKGRKAAASYQLFWMLAVVGVLLFSGCATRSYVDTMDDLVRSDARRRTLSSHSDLLDEIDRVENRLDTLRSSVLSSSEIRREQHRTYWNHKLDGQQACLDELRKEVMSEQ